MLLWSGQNQSEKSLEHFIRQFFFFGKTLLYCPKYDPSSLNYLYSLNELKNFPLLREMQILHIFDFVALFTILSRVDAVRLELWAGNHCTVIFFFFFSFWFVTWSLGGGSITGILFQRFGKNEKKESTAGNLGKWINGPYGPRQSGENLWMRMEKMTSLFFNMVPS